MWIIPVRLPPIDIHVHADRRLAFQVLTAFGAAAPGAAASSQVLWREPGRLLVKFETPARGPLGRRKVYKTLEWVVPHEPERIEFETVQGPLSMMRDRFLLEEQQGCTRLVYESEFGVKGSALGWLVAMLYVRPLLRRLMREHLREMKTLIEARAHRSRLFPQQPCTLEVTGSYVSA